jgi:hypothetical protein
MRLLLGAAFGACATIGLTVLVSSACPSAPHWGCMAFAAVCGAVAGMVWQRNETRKEEYSNNTITHLTSLLRKKGAKV